MAAPFSRVAPSALPASVTLKPSGSDEDEEV